MKNVFCAQRWKQKPEVDDLSSDLRKEPSYRDCLLIYTCSMAYPSQTNKCNFLFFLRNRERNSIIGSVVGDLEWSQILIRICNLKMKGLLRCSWPSLELPPTWIHQILQGSSLFAFDQLEPSHSLGLHRLFSTMPNHPLGLISCQLAMDFWLLIFLFLFSSSFLIIFFGNSLVHPD